MLFDAHADILSDMYFEHKKNNNLDSFKRKHYSKYQKADVLASIFVNYTHPDTKNDREFDEIFDVGLQEVKKNKDIFKICYHHDDINDAYNQGKIGIIIGVEGMKYLRDIPHLRNLYKKGLRHGILTWNEINDYGCGVSQEGPG